MLRQETVCGGRAFFARFGPSPSDTVYRRATATAASEPIERNRAPENKRLRLGQVNHLRSSVG